MVYVISRKAINIIREFYSNVAKKYAATYSPALMAQNILDARQAIYKIENGLPRRKPILSKWRGYYMASYMVGGKTRWNFAYRIEGNTIYVEDACHAQNMHESILRLNESQFMRLLIESVRRTLSGLTDADIKKSSYEAKPKKDARLNDWEIMHILVSVISNMIAAKKISKEDGEMLLHYGLYNNDCYTHINH